MAEIRRVLGFRHVRSEPSSHLLVYRNGRLKASGRGLTGWFMPLSTSIAEIPVDTSELTFLVQAQTRDFQEVTVQGSVGYRIVRPDAMSDVVDFSIDLTRGTYIKEPLEQLASFVIGQCKQVTVGKILQHDLHQILDEGVLSIRSVIDSSLRANAAIEGMGMEIQDVRVVCIAPSAEMEKALCTPARELIQQQADEAMFQRRAMAVEKERAIGENELQSKIELSRKEQSLIEQQGMNDRRRAEEAAAAHRIKVDSRVETIRTEADATADQIRLVEGARAEAEKERLTAYEAVTPAVLLGLAAQTFAEKLQHIEHVSVTPDMLAQGVKKVMEHLGGRGSQEQSS